MTVVPFPSGAVPGTEPAMSTGLPGISLPVRMSRACKRWKYLPPSKFFVTTYMRPVAGSMTGVDVMPVLGNMSLQDTVAGATTGWFSVPGVVSIGVPRVTVQSGSLTAGLSASNA